MNEKNTIAISIFAGFALVAAAVYAVGVPPAAHNILGIMKTEQRDADSFSSPRRADGEGYVYGDPEAETTIVEFSDYECPFCARLHPTLKRIIAESEGNVNWEFRHLPLANHSNAQIAAEISECVGREIGSDAFWEYTDTVFENQRSVSAEYLTSVATELGIDQGTMDACLADPDISEQVALDLATARAFGGSGTPFSVIVFPDGSTRPVTGALPYQNWVALLNL